MKTDFKIIHDRQSSRSSVRLDNFQFTTIGQWPLIVGILALIYTHKT